jgi:hypothetical protein
MKAGISFGEVPKKKRLLLEVFVVLCRCTSPIFAPLINTFSVFCGQGKIAILPPRGPKVVLLLFSKDVIYDAVWDFLRVRLRTQLPDIDDNIGPGKLGLNQLHWEPTLHFPLMSTT